MFYESNDGFLENGSIVLHTYFLTRKKQQDEKHFCPKINVLFIMDSFDYESKANVCNEHGLENIKPHSMIHFLIPINH